MYAGQCHWILIWYINLVYTHSAYSNHISQINTNAPPALPLPGQRLGPRGRMHILGEGGHKVPANIKSSKNCLNYCIIKSIFELYKFKIESQMKLQENHKNIPITK